MSDRPAQEWMWTAAIAAGSSVAVLLAVWFLVIAPQVLEPNAMMRRESERQQFLQQFRLELDRIAQQQSQNQQHQFEAAMKRIEETTVRRVDETVERVVQRQLSDAFLAELRTQVLDQSRQAGSALAPAAVITPAAAGVAVEEMLREDLRALSTAKLFVTETWLSTGKPPSSNTDAGMSAPETFAGKLLRSLTIGADGSITLDFDPKVGAVRAQLVLAPQQPTSNPGAIDWRCSTNFAAMLKIMPLCELRPQLAD